MTPDLKYLLIIAFAFLHSNAFQCTKNILRCRISLSKKDEMDQPKGFGRPKTPVVTSTPSAPFVEDDGLVTKINTEIEVKPASLKTRRQLMIDELDEKIKKLKDEEDLIASDPSVGAVPELVANRMIGRIVAFFGIPVFGGLSIFVGAFFYFKKYDVVVPPTIIAYATQVPFVLGLVGISYAILSSSWDNEPGSLLGIDEFKTNFQRVQDGLSRSKETALLKENIEKESERLGRPGK